MIDPANLPADVENLKSIIGRQIQDHKETIFNFRVQIEERNDQIKLRDEQIDLLQEALRLARRERFAAHSEKYPADQSELFDEAEVLKYKSSDKGEEQDDGIVVPEHKRKRSKRKPLPEHLPREVVVIDLADADKVCKTHGTPLKEIGEEVSERLDIVPAQVKVIRTVRKRYAASCCTDQANILTAKLPDMILPKSNATPGLLAYITTSKYVDALPLYRLETIFKRMDVDIPRNTMARWMIEISKELIPLYNMMEEDLLASDYVCCDETRVQVLKEPDKDPDSQSYMWVRTRHGPNVNPIVLFDYDPTRSKEVPNELLRGFKGWLQVDGYAGYDEICKNPEVTRLGCMAHVRRKFFDVFKASENKHVQAEFILSLIQRLYKIEEEFKDATIEERHKARQESAKLILTDEFKPWVDDNQGKYHPKGLMGKAVGYATNQWERVIRYLEHGKLSIDNNFTENRIRPFAIGRRNWLFSNSVAGAKASAMIYSLLQSARANGLDPYAYMRRLLTDLPKSSTADQIEILLPHKIDPKTLV